MASPQQITANQLNSQSSTGPKTEAGKQQSSRNATRHGFTGQNLVISAAEKEAYENHCIAYLETYSPATQEETSLVQQAADLEWSLHQIFVQQTNLMTLINAITVELMAAGDFQAVVAAIAPLQKSLGTLSTYEARKRRAAQEVRTQLSEMMEKRKLASIVPPAKEPWASAPDCSPVVPARPSAATPTSMNRPPTS